MKINNLLLFFVLSLLAYEKKCTYQFKAKAIFDQFELTIPHVLDESFTVRQG